MKANFSKGNFAKKKLVTTTAEAVEKAIKDEVVRRCKEQDFYVAAQFLAIVLVNLEICYGWKSKRLAKFVNSLNSTAELACDTNIMGKRLDSIECMRHLKDKYGIDCLALTKEM